MLQDKHLGSMIPVSDVEELKALDLKMEPATSVVPVTHGTRRKPSDEVRVIPLHW